MDWQIVGVYRTVRSARMRRDNPEVLVPFWQLPWPSAYIDVRTAQDPEQMTSSITAAVHRVDPQIALAVPRTMEQIRNMVLANDRFTAILFTSFAAVGLPLCALAVYGVMAFSVAQPSREIGLRIALGAGPEPNPLARAYRGSDSCLYRFGSCLKWRLSCCSRHAHDALRHSCDRSYRSLHYDNSCLAGRGPVGLLPARPSPRSIEPVDALRTE